LSYLHEYKVRVVMSQRRSNQNSSAKASKSKGQNNNARSGPKKAAPVSVSRKQTTRDPIISQGPKSMRIVHREYIDDVHMSVLFEDDGSFRINPGLPECFPWLCRVATRFESYKFRKLHYVYEPAVSTASSGSIMMAIDYDARDELPTTKAELMAFSGAVRAAPWEEVRLVASEQGLNLHKSWFTRSGDIPTGQASALYDIGRLVIASSGGLNSIVGELYVEYDVELMIPQLNFSGEIMSCTLKSTSTTETPAKPFGTAPVEVGSYDLAYDSTTGAITFESAGEFIVVIDIEGTNITGLTWTPSTNFVELAGTFGDNLEGCLAYKVKASRGTTAVLSASADTVTSCKLFLGEFQNILS
jgi:hypothetical protein